MVQNVKLQESAFFTFQNIVWFMLQKTTTITISCIYSSMVINYFTTLCLVIFKSNVSQRAGQPVTVTDI